MVFSKLLNKVCIRENIRHSLSNHLAACLVVAHTRITGLLILDQVMHILSALSKGIENYLSKLIVLDRIPFFNEMCKLMSKSTEHCILSKLVNILDFGDTCIQINVDGAGLASAKPALCPLEFTIRTCLRAIQHNVNTSSLCHSAEILISLSLGIVKGLSQVGNGHTLALHNALPASGLAVGCSIIPGIQFLRFGVRCCLACLISKLLLGVSQITSCLAALHIIHGNAAFAHIIGYPIGRIILSHILTGSECMDHSLSLGAVLIGSILQGNSFCLGFLSCRGFLGNLLVICWLRGLLGNCLVFLNSCCGSFRQLYLCHLCRFRYFGHNLGPGSFCGLLWQLSRFHKAAILLGIDPLGADILSPCRRILPGLDVICVQLICHSLTILAAGNDLHLGPGQLFACSLLCQRRSNSTHIPSFTQLGKPGFRCTLDIGHILCRKCCLILLHKAVQLTAGEILSKVQSTLHLLCKGIVRVDFKRLANKRARICTIDLLCSFILSVINEHGLNTGLQAGAYTTRNEATKHVKGKVIRHVFPRCFLRLILRQVLLRHIVIDQDIKITLIAHHKLVGEIIEKRGNTFLGRFNAGLQKNVSKEIL